MRRLATIALSLLCLLSFVQAQSVSTASTPGGWPPDKPYEIKQYRVGMPLAEVLANIVQVRKEAEMTRCC